MTSEACGRRKKLFGLPLTRPLQGVAARFVCDGFGSAFSIEGRGSVSKQATSKQASILRAFAPLRDTLFSLRRSLTQRRKGAKKSLRAVSDGYAERKGETHGQVAKAKGEARGFDQFESKPRARLPVRLLLPRTDS
jgi:hypothetical protein